MKIILFIGHHKVGSSALQDHLARHAVSLLRQGVLYPAVEGQGLSLLLHQAMTGEVPDLLPPNLREAHNALAFSMISDHNGSAVPPLHEGLPPTDDMLRIIERQVEVFAPRVVVLAAEVFSHFANMSVDMIKRLTDIFPDAEIEVTATLRRVDDYLVSWHGQRLRFGQHVRPLPQGAMAHYFKTIHFNYRNMLEGWIKTLPNATLRLRRYDLVLAAGGSVRDFMTQAGLPDLPERGERVNAGLHRALIEIARQLNLALEPDAAAQAFQTLLRLGPALDLPPSSGIELYGDTARARLTQRFKPIQDWLSALAGGVPFFPDFDEMVQLCPHSEYEANRTALAQLTGQHAQAFGPEAQRVLANLELAPNYP